MIRTTPLIEARLPELPRGERVLLKLECLQLTGSFKLRGALSALGSMDPPARERGVITASAGNHGAGLAQAGRVHGVNVTVVVPVSTPQVKLDRIARLGADVTVSGADYDAAESIARRLATETGACFLSAFDDDAVIDGNGHQLAAEIHRQEPGVTRVAVPVGGGGLLAGVASYFADSEVDVYGVQPEANCAMSESLKLGRALTRYQGKPTCAKGCEGAVCERTYNLVQRHSRGVFLVSEAAIESAVASLYHHQGVVAECSGAVAVAGFAAGALPPMPGATTALVISGGNIDDEELDRLLGY